MEFKLLPYNLKNLAPNGVTLNIDEKMQVTLALTQLQGEMNFEELYFWGKVEGKYRPTNPNSDCAPDHCATATNPLNR